MWLQSLRKCAKSLFNPPNPQISKTVNFGNFGEIFYANSLFLSLFLSKFSPKHVQKLLISLFPQQSRGSVLALFFLGFKVLRVRCSFLATIYTVCFILLYNMFYCFIQYISYLIFVPSMSPYFIAYFVTLMMFVQPSWVRICLNTQFVLRSTCVRCFLPCFCLDLLVSMLFAMLMLRSIYLCAPCHAYAQIYMFMCSLPCLCLDPYLCVLYAMLCVQIYMLDAMSCASLAFMSLDISLSCLLALQVRCRSRSCGLGLHPYTRPILKGLDHFLYVCVCLLASMLYVHVCLPRFRFCHAWCSPWACACMVASVPLVACSDVTICENTSL